MWINIIGEHIKIKNSTIKLSTWHYDSCFSTWPEGEMWG